MAQQAPPELLGIHVNFPATVPPDAARALQCGDPPPAGLSAGEKRAYEQLTILYARRRAYAAMMGTRPQTLYGTGGLARRAGRLAAGPRGRLGPAGRAGHLGRARAHQPRTSRR